MYKKVGYLVNVHINKQDDKGVNTDENFEYDFFDENLELIELRRRAIKKTRSLITFFDLEIEGDSKFSSFYEAEKQNFKNVNSYSITINFVKDEDEDPIFGAEIEEAIDWLENEFNYYRDFLNYNKQRKVVNISGNTVSVLEEDFMFLINNEM
jgi:hypothetical protein